MSQLRDTWSLPRNRLLKKSDNIEEYWHTMSILQKSQQISGGYFYSRQGDAVDPKEIYWLYTNPKLQTLIATLHHLVRGGHRKIVVWHYYACESAMLFNEVQKHYTALHAVDNMLATFGKTFDEDSEEVHVLIMPLLMSRGLNDLVPASVDIYYSNTYSQETRDQAEARLARLGQKSKKVIHIDLACPDLADWKVVSALQTKSMTPERLNTIVTEIMTEIPQQRKTKL